MHIFDTLDELREFLAWVPDTTVRGQGDQARRNHHDTVVDWLVEDGKAEPLDDATAHAADGDPVTLFVLGLDASSGYFVYAVPDRVVTAEQRAALDALCAANRAPVFCYEFHGDISAPQYPGALWTLVLLRPDDGIDESEVDRLAGGVEGIDTDAMKAALGAWSRYEITDLRQLRGSIRHLYAVRFAM